MPKPVNLCHTLIGMRGRRLSTSREDVNEDREQLGRVSLWLIVSVEITNHRIGEVVMSNQGVIFKRCGCQDTASGRRFGRTCPQLAEVGYGSWYFHVSVTNLMGRRERVRRGGYPTRAAARHARDAALDPLAGGSDQPSVDP